MKNIFVYIAALLIILMLFLPLISIKDSKAEENKTQIEEISLENEKSFKVLITETDEIKEISANDYIFGVVAAEMPALYSEEALKAQAVAAYTYALRRKQDNKDKGYDITDSPDSDQHYISFDAAKEKWGEKAEEYTAKIKNVVASVEGEYIAFSGEPILALYHSCSGGKTEDAKDVFSQELPYLVSVDSSLDIMDKDYSCEQRFLVQEFSSLLEKSVNFSGEAAGWIKEIKHRGNGYVESVTVCDKTFSGTDFRKIFSLRSANFNIKFDNGFVFSVRGYGHGVGLSQSGAEQMAKQGGTYKEILLWYYKNTEILKKN